MRILSRRDWLCGVLLSPLAARSASAEVAPSPCPKDLSAILKPFTQLVGVRADFVEEKRIALLRKPLVNTGSLVFMAPDQLVRRVDAPMSSAIWVKRGQVWVRDGAGERKLDVTRWGPANVLINSFLYVLRGDAESLRKHYRIEVTCEGARWKLRLTPRAAELAKILRYLVIIGREATPESLEMLDGAGDRSLTRFTRPNTQARFTGTQLKKFFRAAVPKP